MFLEGKPVKIRPPECSDGTLQSTHEMFRWNIAIFPINAIATHEMFRWNIAIFHINATHEMFRWNIAIFHINATHEMF